MFIRKRERKLKDGRLSATYQAIETFTQNGKTVRKVISLHEYSTPQEALEFALRVLEKYRACVNHPTDQYREIRHSYKYNRPMIVPVSVKTAEKRRLMWLKLFEKQKARVNELQNLVSKNDT